MLTKIKNLLGAALVVLGSFAQAESITLASGDWAPYLAKDLKSYGYASDIVTKAFAKAGYEVDYVFLPWKRSFEEAKAGKYAGSPMWGKNAEREQDFLYSNPILTLETVFFKKAGSDFDWSATADLKGKKIGGVVGYAYGLEEEEKNQTVVIDRLGKPEGNYKKLESGRIDAVIEDRDVGMTLVNELGLTGAIEIHPKPVNARDYHLIVPKTLPNAQQLVDAFNKGLATLKESGEFDAIVAAGHRGEYGKQ